MNFEEKHDHLRALWSVISELNKQRDLLLLKIQGECTHPKVIRYEYCDEESGDHSWGICLICHLEDWSWPYVAFKKFPTSPTKVVRGRKIEEGLKLYRPYLPVAEVNKLKGFKKPKKEEHASKA